MDVKGKVIDTDGRICSVFLLRNQQHFQSVHLTREGGLFAMLARRRGRFFAGPMQQLSSKLPVTVQGIIIVLIGLAVTAVNWNNTVPYKMVTGRVTAEYVRTLDFQYDGNVLTIDSTKDVFI